MGDQKLNFFCQLHQTPSNVARGISEVKCDQGPHLLSDNFPYDQVWEYCCSCQHFWARQNTEMLREACPVCDRRVSVRYLCDNCQVVCFESEIPSKRRDFMLSPAGAPQPGCPGCLSVPRSRTFEHRCESLQATVVTPRRLCPFCSENTEPIAYPPTQQELTESYIFPPTFRAPNANYLANLDSQAINVATAAGRPNVLTRHANGIFWLTRFRDERSFIALPNAARFNSAQDYLTFRPIFDCSNPASGEVWIVAPAVTAFNPTTDEWTLIQKGKLEVQTQVSVPPLPQPQPPPAPTWPESRPSGPEPQSETPAPTGNKKFLLIAGLSIGVVLIASLVAYFVINSTKRAVLGQARRGNLVKPQGDSAYDLFLRGGLSTGERAEIRQEVTPLLEGRGNQILNQLITGDSESEEEWAEAIRLYAWLDDLSPQNSYKARRAYAQARSAYLRKDYSGAEKDFGQAIKLEPNWALPVNSLARVFMRRKDYLGAQNCYQRAIELDSTWIFPRINLCVLSVENTKNYQLGEVACRNVLQLDPNKASGHYYLGRALEEQNRGCEALGEYRSALQNAANTPNPGFNVERLNSRVNQLTSRLFCGN